MLMHTHRIWRILLIAIAIPTLSGFAQATDWYVAPAGTSGGKGTQASPWDITSTLQSSTVKPGDTVWLEGGTYGDGSSQFNSTLSGTNSSPIIVRAVPGQRATINGGLAVNGSYTWYWGFEVTNLSVTNRNAQFVFGFDIFGPGTRFINLVVHDTGLGFGFWSPAVDSEIYGSLIYYNGYDLPDRGHGHGVYAQNTCGGDPKNIENNIIFRQFGNGTQLYGSDSACGDNVTYKGNTFFNNGEPSIVTGMLYNIWIGAGGGDANAALINNYTYAPQWAAQEFNRFFNVTNGTITGNYFMAPDVTKESPMAFGTGITNLTMSGNTFLGVTDFADGGYSTSQFPNNSYLTARPTQNFVVVEPNKYETGRANITIFNWQLSPSVSVDISSAGLKPGDEYEVLDAENFYGSPVVTGSYNGQPINIPMNGLTAAPVFAWSYVPKSTAPEFGAFVVLPTASQNRPLPPTRLTATVVTQ